MLTAAEKYTRNRLTFKEKVVACATFTKSSFKWLHMLLLQVCLSRHARPDVGGMGAALKNMAGNNGNPVGWVRAWGYMPFLHLPGKVISTYRG
jgi:hypothetical protein